MEEGLRHRGTPHPTLLLHMIWRRKAVWPHLRSESPFSPGGGMGLVFASVMCVHTGGIRYMGRGRVLPPL